jgi:hypothetical protein
MKDRVCHLILLPIIFFLLSMVTEARATTYYYTGNVFNQGSGTGDPSLLGDSIRITLKTVNPLTDGSYGLGNNIYSSVSITDGINTFTWTKNAPSPFTTIANVVISNGVITQWYFYGWDGTFRLYSHWLDGDMSWYVTDDGTYYTKMTEPGGTWTSFGCDYSSKPEEPERCFGGIGVRCKGIAGVASFTKHPNTCLVDGWMSVGSILHDKCCLATNNTGFSCSGINKGNKALCKQEWNEAWYNTQCTQLGAPRQWRHTFGPYPYGNTGDDTNQDLRVPSGRRVNPRYEYLCASGKCEVNSNGKPRIRTDACGKYCKCQ